MSVPSPGGNVALADVGLSLPLGSVAQQGQPAESRILLIQTATGESLVPDSRATGSNRYAFGFLDWDFDRWTSNRPNEERVLALTH